MLGKNPFKVLLEEIKSVLPDKALRQHLEKMLEDCDILTHKQLQQYLLDIENMRSHIKKLEARITSLEEKQKKKELPQ